MIARNSSCLLGDVFRRSKPMLADSPTQRPRRKQREKMLENATGFLRFHFSDFRYSLTLFSKFFASFPHGTCTLSVSHRYLALDGIYHPLRAAIPSNSTRRRHMLMPQTPSQIRGCHPFKRSFPEDLDRGLQLTCFSIPQLGTTGCRFTE